MFCTIIIAMNSLTKQEVAVLPMKEEPAPVIEKTTVVVAKTNMQPRTIIQEGMLQMKELPVDMVPEGAIKNFSEVQGVQIKVTIFAGDILTIQKVFSEKSDEGFVGAIPADCRAVSISVNDLTGVAGFAKPGDRVDLLLVEKGKYSATTNILLQNVPILSINQDMDGSAPVGENGVPAATISNPSIATFALPPQDVLKLVSAAKLGEIYMVLRPSNPQHSYVGALEYTIESINAPQPEPVREVQETPVIPSNSAPLPQIPVVPIEPAVPKIDIIQGDQIVQRSEPTKSATQSSSQTAANLPAIPSNATPVFNAPSVPDTPLANSPVINQTKNN